MVKKIGKYELGKTLGEGTFGKVKFAINTETGEKVAIKILEKETISKQNMGGQIKKEISIMKRIQHPHVVGLKEVLASRTKIFIVLELVIGGELFERIVAETKFPENKARFYFKQLVDGVFYCHSQGVCHRDLKPENLLLDENMNLKISDFGLSALYNSDMQTDSAQLLHTTCGTPNYVAPEVLLDKGYDGRLSDIWSMGVILYVLMAGYLPFDEPNMSDLFRKIQRAEYTFPSWFSPESKAIIQKILVPDPTRRATIRDILDDPWMKVDGSPTLTGSSPPIQSTDAIEQFTPINQTDITSPSNITAPVMSTKLTAFHLICAFGFKSLSKMVEKDEKPVARNAYLLVPKNISNLLDELQKIVQGVPRAKLECQSAPINKYCVTIQEPKLITMNVQIFSICEDLCLCEIQKGKGDILEYQKLYSSVVEPLSRCIPGLNVIHSKRKMI